MSGNKRLIFGVSSLWSVKKVGRTRRLTWVLTTAALLVAGWVTIAHLYGVPQFIAASLNRRVTRPAAEEYAVYSAFVDGFFSSNQPFRADQSISQNSVVYIVDETSRMASPGSILPLDVVTMGPNDMGEDFYRKNGRTWQLNPLFHTKWSVVLVGKRMARSAGNGGAEKLFEDAKSGEERNWLPHPSATGPFPESPQVSGVLQLSRAGFNWRGTLALLYYSYRCGFLCGQSGWVVLHKDEGHWLIERFGAGVVY